MINLLERHDVRHGGLDDLVALQDVGDALVVRDSDAATKHPTTEKNRARPELENRKPRISF